MDVGFIGLGTMGGPMARNVLKKGHRLDRVRHAIRPRWLRWSHAGARAASTPKEVAAASDIVITMLPDAPDVERVALGADGIAEGVRAGAVYIDMSTIDPGHDAARRRDHRGARRIDDRQSRRQDGRRGGRRHAHAHGGRCRRKSIARCRPVLDCMGTDFFHCGELGAGQTIKLINNLLATAIAEASIEALVTGTKSGLTLDTMLSVFRTTMAWSSQLAVAMPKRPLAGDFTPGFMMKLAHKDCRLALAMAEGLGVSAPVGRAALASLEEGLGRGLSDDDVGALLKLREEAAGVQVRLAPA